MGKLIKIGIPIVLIVGIIIFLTVGGGVDIIKDLVDKNLYEGNSYTVTYYDGSDLQEIVVTNGKAFQLTSVPEKVGYTFLGLFDAQEGGNKYVDENGVAINPYAERKDLRLYAQYEIKSYALIFDLQGGSANGMQVNSTVNYGEKLNDVPDYITYYGRTFNGWYTAPNGEGTKITEGATVVNEATFTIEANTTSIICYAHWELITYDVILNIKKNDGYGEIVERIKVPHGTPISSIRTETLVDGNNMVVGWSYDPNGKVTTEAVENNMTLYSATYQKVVIVTFNSNGGAVVDAKIVPYEANTEITLPETTKSGSRFVGWVYGELLLADGKLTLTGEDDITLVAKWSDPLVISFNTDGGDAVSSIYVTELNTSVSLPVPTRKKHKFVGWMDSSNNMVSNPLEITAHTVDNIVLKACWEYIESATSYTISPVSRNCNDNNGFNIADSTGDLTARNEVDAELFDIIIDGVDQKENGRYSVPGTLKIGLKLLQDPDDINIFKIENSGVHSANVSDDTYNGKVQNTTINGVQLRKGALYVSVQYTDGTTDEGYKTNLFANKTASSYIDVFSATGVSLDTSKRLERVKITVVWEYQASWNGFLSIPGNTVTNWRTDTTFLFG